jgi:hypothetical protein
MYMGSVYRIIEELSRKSSMAAGRARLIRLERKIGRRDMIIDPARVLVHTVAVLIDLLAFNKRHSITDISLLFVPLGYLNISPCSMPRS